ncbi:ABC-F family ATP-binding cassette domain-containing protein [Glutamicibacter endophyticus]|uniref:ABC-F family ATP-binding cassette domain-containing protein n=1 Tax=Glutamicibacter endophyticus TaxID=1522174 RepID=UPI003AF1CC49
MTTSSLTTPNQPAVSLAGVHKSFAEHDVLRGVDLTVQQHSRIALVGDNGSGKSTLLGIIAGVLSAEVGTRQIVAPGGIAYAAQDPDFATLDTVGAVITSFHREALELEELRRQIEQRLSQATGAQAQGLLAQWNTVNELYHSHGADGWRRRTQRALAQLGLGEFRWEYSTAALSGGQRARLALGCALSAEADLLLLDEPTNDLDESALRWLVARMQQFRGTLLVASHDRHFLRAFTDEVLELDDGTLLHYGAGYDAYLKSKRRERQVAAERFERWQAEVQDARRLVEKNAARTAAIPRKAPKAGFGHGEFRQRNRAHGSGSKVRQAKARIAMLQGDPVQAPAPALAFALPEHAPESSVTDGGALVELRDAVVAAPDLIIGDLRIEYGQRWLVSGANGAGKTTLLRALAGEAPLSSGGYVRRASVDPAWLRQSNQGYEGRTVLSTFARALQLYAEDAARELLRVGLLAGELLLEPVASLSVGQRRRLELSIALCARSPLLLLDEPTNHLAPDVVEQLEQALVHYPGAICSVSHDPRWRQRFLEHPGGAGELLVADGIVRRVR